MASLKNLSSETLGDTGTATVQLRLKIFGGNAISRAEKRLPQSFRPPGLPRQDDTTSTSPEVYDTRKHRQIEGLGDSMVRFAEPVTW